MRRTASLLAGALLVAGIAGAAPAAAASYQNCTALQQSYPHGVGKANAVDKVRGKGKPVTTWKRDTAEYNRATTANGRLDADKDGVACEKK